MKILIVTGIFEPETGGPATYAPKLARKLTEAGHEVTVLTYSRIKHAETDASYPFSVVRVVRGNKLLNRVRMFLAARRLAAHVDIAYMLDWFAAGQPASLAMRGRHVPYVVRVGGDYLYERHLQSGGAPVTLVDFYGRDLHKSPAYLPYARAVRSVLGHAERVVFNSERQQELYRHYMAIDRSSVIFNPLPTIDVPLLREQASKEFVFWGRLVAMKNVATLVRGFGKANLPPDFRLTIIGEGPEEERLRALTRELGLEERVTFEPAMPLPEVLARVRDARAAILPSWTDISPNQFFEALAIGVPVLLTSENYLPIRAQLPMMIDPRYPEDIAAKLEILSDDGRYSDFVRRFSEISYDQTWDDALRQHMYIFEDIVKHS